MFKKFFYKFLLVIVGLLLGETLFAQSVPNANYSALPGGFNEPTVSVSVLCPNTTSTYRIEVNTADAGATWFEWVVYGGTITDNNLSSPAANQATGTQMVGTIPYYYISHDNYSSGATSSITVQWHSTDVNGAWVAVRQHSEWGCYAGPWSVYTNDIFDSEPVFSNFPTDITISNESRLSFTLPLPGASDPDDGCLAPLTYSYMVTGASAHGPTPATDDASRTVDLGVGVNTVTWTIFDGLKTVSRSYTITVDPVFSIGHVAWIDPYCVESSPNSGSAMVTATSLAGFPVSSTRQVVTEYNFDNAGWISSAEIGTLATGNHTVQARLVYSADINGDGVQETLYQPTALAYSFTLHATSTNSASGTPAPGGPDATIKNTSCLGSEDGIVSISRNSAEMVPQNRSVSFDGSSSYLLLNKYYDGPIPSFSVGAWIRTNASSGTIVSFDNSEYFHLGLSTGYPQLTTRTTDDLENQITVDNANYKVNDGQWHLVVATYSAGTYTIYVDGVSVKTQTGGASVGKPGVTRYGMIGALSKNATFSPTPSGSYFTGNIAQVSIWTGALDASSVRAMFTNGMSGDDRWVLNDVPSNVSGDAAFSDCGNLSDPSEWARFYNCTLSSNNAPILLSWLDDADEISTTRDSLPIGIYTLQVRDLFNCGEITGVYEVKNGDDGNPYLLWDAALVTTASASQVSNPDPAHPARLANDGLYDTYASTGEYWDINLGNSFPLGMVRVRGSASGDAWAMVSSSAFSGATLEDDTAAAGVLYGLLSGGSGSVVFDINNATHVRIRTADGGTLTLNEVEVLTYYQPAEIRKLYLTEEDQCSYDITSNDVAVDPVVYDGCEGVSVLTNNPATTGSTMVGQSWGIGTYTENWHAVDDNALESNLTMRYEVVDEKSPEFIPPSSSPFDGVPNNMPHCDALTYPFPIPAVTDNYRICSNMLSISLYYDDDWLAYSYPDMSAYDPTNPGQTTLAKAFVKPGNHRYQWRIEDANGNWLYSEIYTIHIEQDPVLNEVRVASSCNSSADYTVYFANYESEPSAPVEFILHPVSGGPDIVRNSSSISGLAPGIYKATIRVNGCVSNTYSDDVLIPNVTGVTLDENITNVQCLGQNNGSIDLSPSGGSQTNIIHFIGGGATATGADAGLDLGNQGMIECWFFLDSLASGGMNWNTNLFGVGGSYGLRMVNGALQFYAGTASVSLAAGDIVQRTWYHIAGSYSWDGVSSGTISLDRDGTVTTNALAADPAVGGGTAAIGGSLNGFVRNARVWNIAMPADYGANIGLYRPIDPGKNLVVNYPANETGGDQIYNYKTGSNCSVSGSYSRQKFAYYWKRATGYLSFNEDITLQPTGGYTVSVYDPLGCTVSLTDTIRMDDDDPPTMLFYSDHARSASTLGVGEAIVRYDNYIEAPGGGGNALGDCAYFPFDREFDPKVDDGVCPRSAVKLSFSLVAGSDPFGLPAPNPSPNDTTLNGVRMNGIITLKWTATDPNNLSTSQTVSYYVVDDQAPDSLSIADSVRYTDAGRCTFTVPASGLIPVLYDNCNITTGILQNSINANNTLAGVSFAPEDYDIMWTYQDRVYPGITPSAPITKSFTLSVIDQQQPQANCTGAFQTYLDDEGKVDLNYLLFDNHSTDNCGKIAAYRLSKNITPTGTVSSPTTVQWQIDFGASRTIYGLNVTSPSASGFWVLVSSTGAFGHTGDLSENGTTWGGDVTYSQYYSGTVSGTTFIEFNRVAVGQYVRIWLNGAGPLNITDVGIYGSATPASDITMDCDDVRYSATPVPTFSPVGVLFTVVDEQGNASSCLTDVTVTDQIPPTIGSTNTISIPLDAGGSVDLNAHINDISGGTDDNCGVDHLWVDDPIMTCDDGGFQQIVIHAVDINGNQTSGNAKVSIEDKTAPTYTLVSPIQLFLDDDGQYAIKPTDIFASVDDNCTDIANLSYSFSKPVVYCSDRPYIDLIATIMDGNGQVATVEFKANDPVIANRVQVIDNRPPVVSLSNFVLTIPEDGDSVIRFQDLIHDNNIYDNCDKLNVPTKQIKYVACQSCPWCNAGNEGNQGAENAYSNVVITAGVVTGYNGANGNSSTAYTGTNLNNMHDGAYATTNAADVYITNANSGTRSVYYYLNNTYEFDQSSISWHSQRIETNSVISRAAGVDYVGYTSTSEDYGSSTTNYCYSNLNDNQAGNNNASNIYVSDGTMSGTDWLELVYDFNASRFVSDMTINFTGDIGSGIDARTPGVVELYIYNGTDWGTAIATSSTGNDNISFTNINRITTQVRLRCRRQDGYGSRRLGVREWTVNGSVAANNCSLPSSNTLYYWSTTSNQWVSLGSFTATAANVFFTKSISCSTNAFRLDMAADWRVGIQEWRLNGRVLNATSACTKNTCTSVQKYVPVWLQWGDQSGNMDSTQVQVWVEPYFNITDIHVKDCGFAGEKFYPVVENVKQDVSTTYIWTETDGRNEGLFSGDVTSAIRYWGGANTSTTYPPIPARTIANPADTYCGLGNTNGSWTGNYSLNLRVVDNNGCYDDYDYPFVWDLGEDTGTSIKAWAVCKGASERFEVLFPKKYTFWRRNYNWFVWPAGDGCYIRNPGGGGASAAPLSQITGTTAPTTLGDSYIDVSFPTATAPGTTCNVEFWFKGQQFGNESGYSTVTSPSVQTGPITLTGGAWSLEILESLSPEGPYFTATNATQNATYSASQKYVLVTGNNWYTGDYGGCLEKMRYEVTVYDVEDPEIYAYDRYNTTGLGVGWHDANLIQVCPRDTIWYRVNNYITNPGPSADTIYAYFDWDIMRYADINGDGKTDTIPTGRRLQQGNSYNDSIQIVWDQFPETPRLTVKGFNKLDCSSDATVIPHTYIDNDPPVLKGNTLSTTANYDCSSMDTTHYTATGRCGYTFTNLPPPPVITDDCRNRIKDYWCDVDTTGDGVKDFTAKNAHAFYPVGTSTVSWFAMDYSNHTSPACEQDVIVVDNVVPQFNKVPVNDTLHANSSGWGCYTHTDHNLTATDNCGVQSVTASIDLGNKGSWDYTGLATIDEATCTRHFPLGVSRVRWYANDIHGNRDSIDFTVVVRDLMKPVISTLDTIKSNTNVACTRLFTAAELTQPGDDKLWDNSSPDSYLSAHVTFVSRSDGKGALLDPYEKGTTTITWRVTDESGNYGEQTQVVVISDKESPTFDAAGDADLQKISVSYCNRMGFRLHIPTPYDNCGITNVRSITYTVTRTSDNTVVVNHTINRVNGAFNPHGTDLTDSIPNFYQYVYPYSLTHPDGTNFTVTWSAIDESNNPSIDYSYNLHVEIEPVFSTPSVYQMSCGGASDGSIVVDTTATNTAAYHYDRSYRPQFSIDQAGASWFPKGQTTFDGLKGGSYKVRMMVNGCLSTSVYDAFIDAPTPYSITAASTDVLCHEDQTGTITLTMSGGAAGQLHFTGTPVTATSYTAIERTTAGAYGGWVYLDALAAGTILSKGDCSLAVNAAGNFSFTVNGTSAVSSFAAVARHWYYVTGSWDGTNVSVSVGGNVASVSSSVASAGGSGAFSMGGFSGILRDVKIWNSAAMTDAGIVGYWRLNNGSGDTSPNKNSGSNPATGCAGLWHNNLPQPGTYTWTRRNGSFFSNEINLTNLGIDTLNVSFVDPYGCPNPPLTLPVPVIIHATDKIAPVIQKLDTVHVYANNTCEFQVALEPNLRPTITDAGGGSCQYDVTWKLVTMPNKDVLMYEDSYEKDNSTATYQFNGATLGRKRLNGVNEVTVTATQNVSQNDSTYSTWTYYINVKDSVRPHPDGRFDESPSLNLDASGQVQYTAKQFNRASSDNCSDPDEMTYLLSTDMGATWDDTIHFDCSAIGISPSLWFRVIDEAGNSAVQTGSFSTAVNDVTPPVIIKNTETKTPYCAIHDANGGVPAYNDEISLADFALKVTDYSDNCGVTRLRYKLEHETYTPPIGTPGYGSDWLEIAGTVSGHSYTFTFDPTTMLTFYEGITTITLEAADGSDALGRRTAEKAVFKVTVSPKPTPKTNVQ